MRGLIKRNFAGFLVLGIGSALLGLSCDNQTKISGSSDRAAPAEAQQSANGPGTPAASATPAAENPPQKNLVSIEVTADKNTLTTNEAVMMTAIAIFDDGSTEDITNSATWTSLSPDILSNSADQSPNTFQSTGPGSATVQASYNGLEASVVITISSQAQPPTLDGITIHATKDSLNPNEFLQLQVEAHYSDGSTKDVTNAADWLSAQPQFISVEPLEGAHPGQVQGIAPGTATIKAVFEGQSAEISLTVTANPTNENTKNLPACEEDVQYNPQSVLCSISVDDPNNLWNQTSGWKETARTFVDRTAHWISPLEQVHNYCPTVPKTEKLLYVTKMTLGQQTKVKFEAMIDNQGSLQLWKNGDPNQSTEIFTITTVKRGSRTVDLAAGNYTIVIDGLDQGGASAILASIRDDATDEILAQSNNTQDWCIFRVAATVNIKNFIPKAAICRSCFSD